MQTYRYFSLFFKNFSKKYNRSFNFYPKSHHRRVCNCSNFKKILLKNEQKFYLKFIYLPYPSDCSLSIKFSKGAQSYQIKTQILIF